MRAAIREEAVIVARNREMPARGLEAALGIAFAGLVNVEAMPGFRRQLGQVSALPARQLEQRRGRGADIEATWGRGARFSLESRIRFRLRS